MKSVLKWGFICLIVFVVFLIVKLPAAQVISRVQLPSEVTVHGVSGTIWNGHAASVSVQGLPIHDVNWQLAFLPLLTGTASLDVKDRKSVV